MKAGFYEILKTLGKNLGLWVVALFAWLVSTGYFLFRPTRVRNSMRFYKAAFPDRGFPGRLGLTLRQFHHFATGFVDRLRLAYGKDVEFETEGMEAFFEQTKTGRGGVIIMSHFGNWEIAARLLQRQNVRLLLYLGQVAGQDIETGQKQDIAKDGVKVVVADDRGGSPFDLLEGVHFLREGGFVSIAGDRVQTDRQRTVKGVFFGRRVTVPVAPHLLSRVSGNPVFHLFPIRLGPGRFKVVVRGPVDVHSWGRMSRDRFIRRSAQEYLNALERMVRKHPDHWYHFERFLGEPVITDD
ncbi:MAG: hypothetical protein ACLFOY_03625 [Desulfatibacillaceae bacterium]